MNRYFFEYKYHYQELFVVRNRVGTRVLAHVFVRGKVLLLSIYYWNELLQFVELLCFQLLEAVEKYWYYPCLTLMF